VEHYPFGGPENDAYEATYVVMRYIYWALMMPNFNSELMVYDNPYNTQLLAMDTNQLRNKWQQPNGAKNDLKYKFKEQY